MSTHTDSQLIEHHDDGSRTTTTVVTSYPATKTQQAVAIGALSALALAPIAPLLIVIGLEKWDARRARKRKLKSVPN